MIKLLVALLIPFFLVLLFSRVTYNHYVGTGLTLALLIVAFFNGHMDSTAIWFLDVASLIAGFMVSKKMIEDVKRVKQ
ncbi:DUF2198 family protein [Bacillus carboniphilus]|uniref:DUF2198 family protein n=1 Tax=Bacillus carboniphilus TaxID=86663 RepID=A0ABY9JQ70_9BACI|nr:DUF2198 family protein [Bacillus carboniphilus]WLR41472.1 DUF2198 family protein [Bacillus carboniphilus]